MNAYPSAHTSVQSKIALISGLLVVFMGAIVSISYANYFNLVNIILFSLPMVVLVAFDINCVVAGQCETWGWIKTIMVLLVFAVAFYVQAMYLRGSPKERVPSVVDRRYNDRRSEDDRDRPSTVAVSHREEDRRDNRYDQPSHRDSNREDARGQGH